MSTELYTQGDRIRALFECAEGEITVIAPFIKVDALRSLIKVINADAHLRCVSRWLPREIAAGVSDPEILDLLETRGNFSLSLADQLHAKLYIAGDRCLAGSANVTLAGLGEERNDCNIEVLVETTIDEPGVAATLEAISKVECPATREMARTVRRLADCIADSPQSNAVPDDTWFPRSRCPEKAYAIYSEPLDDFLGTADQVLLGDLAHANLPLGLGEDVFRDEIRSLLKAYTSCGQTSCNIPRQEVNSCRCKFLA